MSDKARTMTRPQSRLIHARFSESADGPRLIALHRQNAFVDSMRTLAIAANPTGSSTGVESSKGYYVGRNILGYTWFVGPLKQPSPVHFGDSLMQLEEFVLDEIDRQQSASPAAPFLLGEEQGGAMALALGAANPDLLSGIVAIDGWFPDVPGWDPPLAPLNGLPILLINPENAESLQDRLTAWGASVTIADGASDDRASIIAAWVQHQPTRIAPTADSER